MRQTISFKIYLKCVILQGRQTKLSDNFKQLIVVCKDLNALTDAILRKRGREEADSLLIKISIDGGGGFLKICQSIFDINDLLPKTNSAMSKKFLESGVKKVFIIRLVPDVNENYGMDILKKKYVAATDLKLCNIILGIMSHGSCHPCL